MLQPIVCLMIGAFLLLLGGVHVESANILGFFGIPSISHSMTFNPIIRALAEKGHNLTVITTDPIGDPTLLTLTEIDVHDVSYGIWNKYNISSPEVDDEGSTDLAPIFTAFMEITDKQLGHPRVKSLIKESSNYQFDLLICQFPHFAYAPLQTIYNASVIGISSLPLHFNTGRVVGNPNHPTLYPDLNLPYGNKLTTFWQRVNSFIYSTIFVHLFTKTTTTNMETAMAQHYGWDLVRRNQETLLEIDMIMVNYNPVLYSPRPNVPAVVEFSGIHIQPPKELPKDLKTFLDSASGGAVYVSFGSSIKSSALPKVKRDMIVQTFAELPYKILWKFEADLENLPKNVMIIKWAPQQDILRHSNVKLFVTQGGIQSLDEAMHSKTPVLAIPFLRDQLGNAVKVEEARIGKQLHFGSLTKETLRESIMSIINDDQYKVKMEEVYDILTDQPMSALEKTVWWVEYVLRHKGARHLRCPATDATLIEFYMIDVIGFLLTVAVVVLFLIYTVAKLMIKLAKKLLRCLLSFFSNDKKVQKVKKTN